MRKLDRVELEIEYNDLLRKDWSSIEIFQKCPHLRHLVVEKTLWMDGLPIDRIIRTDRPYPFTIAYDPVGVNSFVLAKFEDVDYLTAGMIEVDQVNAISLLNYEYRGEYWDIHGDTDPIILATIKKIKDMIWYLYNEGRTRLAVDIREIVNMSNNLEVFQDSLSMLDEAKADIPLKREINRVFNRLVEKLGYLAKVTPYEILITRHGGDYAFFYGSEYDELMEGKPKNVNANRWVLYRLQQDGRLEVP